MTTFAAWGGYMNFGPMFSGTLDTSATYNTQFEWRSESEYSASNFSYQVVQGNGVSAAASLGAITSHSTLQPNGWYLFNADWVPNNAGISAYNRIILGPKSTPAKLYIRKVQMEKNSFATPFVDGERANAESILDISGNQHTFISNNLIYNSDSTFEFEDGTTNSGIALSGKTRAELFPSETTYSLIAVAKRNGPACDDHTHAIVLGFQGYNVGIMWNASTDLVYVSNFRRNEAASNFASVSAAGATIPDDTWVHVAMTFNANGFLKCYVNGEFTDSEDASIYTDGWYGFGTWANSQGLTISGSSAYFLNGSIDMGLGYDRELTADEIKAHFNSVRGRYGL
jgi:hypothetical protein